MAYVIEPKGATAQLRGLPRACTLKDGRRATLARARDEQLPDVHLLLNEVIADQDKYPQDKQLAFEDFAQYYLSHDAFTLTDDASGALEGAFYIKVRASGRPACGGGGGAHAPGARVRVTGAPLTRCAPRRVSPTSRAGARISATPASWCPAPSAATVREGPWRGPSSTSPRSWDTGCVPPRAWHTGKGHACRASLIATPNELATCLIRPVRCRCSQIWLRASSADTPQSGIRPHI